MRRLGGILLLVLFTACGDGTTVEQTGPAALPPPESTTSTPTTTTTTSTSTTTTLSTTTPTTVARATTTVPARTAPTARQVPTTSAAGRCDPNYSGACVPVDSDVDCAGGSGNGPSYVSAKRFQVVGDDIYGLDSDNDGIACES